MRTSADTDIRTYAREAASDLYRALLAVSSHGSALVEWIDTAKAEGFPVSLDTTDDLSLAINDAAKQMMEVNDKLMEAKR